MEIEIKHPPITCPACGHLNNNAISVSIIKPDLVGIINYGELPEDLRGVDLYFCCEKCPEATILKKLEFNGNFCWELPHGR